MQNDKFLTFDKKQASYLSAGIVLVILCAFILGYLLGQRKYVLDIQDETQKTAFEDEVKYSLYSSYRSLPDRGEFNEDSNGETSQIEENVIPVQEIIATESVNEKSNDFAGEDTEIGGIENENKPGISYMAQLFGCSSLSTAKKFADRVKKMGFDTEVKTRISKNSKGKTKTWYQVVTKDYSNKAELLAAVEKIQLVEKIQKVKILEVKN